jgi:hypothetical protein
VVAALEKKGGPCAAEGKGECRGQAERAVAAVERSAGAASPSAALLRARLLAVSIGVEAAKRHLTKHCTPLQAHPACAALALRLASAAPTEEFQKAAREYLLASCEDPATCTSAHRLVGDLFAERQDWAQALLHLETAAKGGSRGAGWRRYAEVARRAGASARATEALMRAERLEKQGGHR